MYADLTLKRTFAPFEQYPCVCLNEREIETDDKSLTKQFISLLEHCLKCLTSSCLLEQRVSTYISELVCSVQVLH